MKYLVLVGHGIGGGKFVYPGDLIDVDTEIPQQVTEAENKVRRGMITQRLEREVARASRPPLVLPPDRVEQAGDQRLARPGVAGALEDRGEQEQRLARESRRPASAGDKK